MPLNKEDINLPEGLDIIDLSSIIKQDPDP